MKTHRRKSFFRLNQLLAELSRRRNHRKAVANLQALDDAMLNDIGISRCDIVRVARSGREGLKPNRFAC